MLSLGRVGCLRLIGSLRLKMRIRSRMRLGGVIGWAF
jgi:hypothetical protein